MNTRNKLHLAVAALLLLALAILLRPREQHPSSSLAEAEHSRPEGQTPVMMEVPSEQRREKDFHTFAKIAAKDGLPELTRQEIDNYLKAQHRDAGSLLAAYRLSKDEAYLKEALEKFPKNPQVLLCAIQLTKDPAKRLEAIEAFKHADPGNGLGNYLAAKALFDLGRNEEAIGELHQARGKTIQDFTMVSCQDIEEAYLAAGFSQTEAKMTWRYNSARPDLLQLGEIAKNLDDLRISYASTGDATTVQSLRDILSDMGGQLQDDPIVVGQLIGLIIEKRSLKGLDDPASIARMEEIVWQNKSLVQAALEVSALMENPNVPEEDWRLYYKRNKLLGEKAANEWILGKYPEPLSGKNE